MTSENVYVYTIVPHAYELKYTKKKNETWTTDDYAFSPIIPKIEKSYFPVYSARLCLL